MKYFAFIIAFLALEAYALPLETYQSKEEINFEKYIRESLENFRAQMKDGIPAMKLPPLEPLHLKDQKVRVNQDKVDLDLKLHEILVEGLSGFEIMELKPDLPNLSIKAILKFPRVVISGIYEVQGKVMKFVPIFGNGNYNVTLVGPELGGSTTLILGEEDMEIMEPTLHCTFQEIHVDIGNFLGGGSFGKTVSKIFSTLGKTLFEQYKPNLLKKASEALTKQANLKLNTDEVRQIVAKLIQGMAGAGS